MVMLVGWFMIDQRHIFLFSQNLLWIKNKICIFDMKIKNTHVINSYNSAVRKNNI